MEKNGQAASHTRLHAELLKDLGGVRTRLAEIASALRREHAPESTEVRLAEEAALAVQKLEAQISGCVSARFEA